MAPANLPVLANPSQPSLLAPLHPAQCRLLLTLPRCVSPVRTPPALLTPLTAPFPTPSPSRNGHPPPLSLFRYTPLTVGAAALSALSVIFFIAAAGHPTMTTFDTASTTVGFGVFRYCLSDKTDECDYYSDGPDYHQLLGIEHFQARRRCSAAFLIFALFLSLAAGGGAVMLFLDKELGLLLGIAASGASGGWMWLACDVMRCS